MNRSTPSTSTSRPARRGSKTLQKIRARLSLLSSSFRKQGQRNGENDQPLSQSATRKQSLKQKNTSTQSSRRLSFQSDAQEDSRVQPEQATDEDLNQAQQVAERFRQQNVPVAQQRQQHEEGRLQARHQDRGDSSQQRAHRRRRYSDSILPRRRPSTVTPITDEVTDLQTSSSLHTRSSSILFGNYMSLPVETTVASNTSNSSSPMRGFNRPYAYNQTGNGMESIRLRQTRSDIAAAAANNSAHVGQSMQKGSEASMRLSATDLSSELGMSSFHASGSVFDDRFMDDSSEFFLTDRDNSMINNANYAFGGTSRLPTTRASFSLNTKNETFADNTQPLSASSLLSHTCHSLQSSPSKYGRTEQSNLFRMYHRRRRSSSRIHISTTAYTGTRLTDNGVDRCLFQEIGHLRDMDNLIRRSIGKGHNIVEITSIRDELERLARAESFCEDDGDNSGNSDNDFAIPVSLRLVGSSISPPDSADNATAADRGNDK
jgi:hypothetical protein